jgi:hypothetical protein
MLDYKNLVRSTGKVFSVYRVVDINYQVSFFFFGLSRVVLKEGV